MSEKIKNVTEADFNAEVTESVLPVLVDCWASWCAPCKALAPKLDEAAEEFQGRLKVVKIDVDANPNLAEKLGIRSIPTLFIVKQGVVKETSMGNMSKEKLTEFIEKGLK